MASLSNINGLFDVHSTGAILFSNTHGTSGQILKSNGNAAPTWVTASTVIGGPYLPLTGGTLSGATATASGISFTVGGALTGTSATFGGNLTVNARGFFNGGGAYPLVTSSTQRYNIQIRNTNNTVNSGYGWWWGTDTNFNMFFHADGASDRMTLTRLGELGVNWASPGGYGQLTVGGTSALPILALRSASGKVRQGFYEGGTGRFYFDTLGADGLAFIDGDGLSERMRITDYGSLVVGNTPGTNVNWGKIQCGGTITVGNSSGTYNTHGRISGDSDGMKLKGTSTGTYSDPQGVTINGYNVGINTNSPNVGNAFGLVIRSWATLSRLVFWNNTSGEVSSRGQRISFSNANCIFENMESGYYAFKTGGSGANPSERMRIQSDGNVGIGKSQSGNAVLTVKSPAGGNTGIILIEGDTTDDGWGVYATTANKYIITRFTGGSYSDKFTILEGGNVGIGTDAPTQPLDVNGYSICDKQFQRDNSTTIILGTPRILNISYRGSSGTYDFNPVTLFGNNPQGGQCEIQVTGWQNKVNNGFIYWRDNGSNTNIGNGIVGFVQTAVVGSGVISVSTNAGGNVITITFTGWHSNGHGWNAKIISNNS